MRKKIDLYTDGACSGNPGPGGWGAILFYKSFYKELSGGEMNTTNNRMELMAIIKGLSALKESCEVTVYSDSAYCVNAFNNGWVYNWQKNNWLTGGSSAVKNIDLWEKLLALMDIHDVKYVKVKGHADNKYNNRCDELARNAINEYRYNPKA